eukprot:TRINITY_DN25661_c0_g1_i1.p1 TRINITY_DN25661_c0_g1~~TRINITY_DN25661_c0_g1_i1.p1  ORF type:complete len:270 (-),score=10.99 TRINITY_DN25661_c0_g1_i1:226-927(-)
MSKQRVNCERSPRVALSTSGAGCDTDLQCSYCDRGQVCVLHERYPYCIVWTPIPLITWLLPFVGHMGIADSRGVIHDFAAPYYISVDSMAFGWPTRYFRVPLPPSPVLDDAGNTLSASSQAERYDRALVAAVDRYQTLSYNFFTNNCHSFAATALAGMAAPDVLTDTASRPPRAALLQDSKLGQRVGWNMVRLAATAFFCGRFVSISRAIATIVPCLVLWVIIAAISGAFATR